MNNTKLQSNFERNVSRLRAWLHCNCVGRGALVLICILAALSVLASLSFTPPVRVYLAGEVASSDVVADHSFVLEDSRATKNRQEQMKAMQPLFCDLAPEGLNSLRGQLQALFTEINAAAPDMREQIRARLAEETGEEIQPRVFQTLTTPEIQSMVLNQILPWMEHRFSGGIISDIRLLLGYKGGVIVRNTRTGQETQYSEAQLIPDLRAVQTELAAMLRDLPQKSVLGKRAALALVGSLLSPTLTPNYDLTKTRATAILQAMEPTLHQVQRGEVIVRQGERVNYEQQLKLQALGQRKSDRFRHTQFIGIFCVSLLIASGLFFSPSGKASSPVQQKDLIFIGVLVGLVALSAKTLGLLGQKLVETNPTFSPETLAYALPLAGVAGLSALIFSTRRYVVTGLLLAFFCSVMHKGSLALFIFYFLSAMWNTWLIVRTQNRQDVVKSILPLLAGLFVMWAGATFTQGGLHTRYFQEAVAVLAGGFLSMFVIFALGPLMEMLFGYVTRFRLMELLNLDQPILRELMISAPGTYHHSLIVSQLVEAGAKTIGAQSLLCKVAALYHDVGKITRPDYFIENQFSRDNPHDRLAPSMSALVLTSHVKKGVELAQAHRLGAEVIDIIRQHHGSNLITYFYKKAHETGENPRLEDFSYPGPKPQSREAALVMLADIVEASSRTLDDPTPNRLQTHIANIIKGIFASGQLDETDLTLKDLNKLSQSFLHVLAGLFHHRIKYPDKVPLKPTAQERLDNRKAGKTADEGAKTALSDAVSGETCPPLDLAPKQGKDEQPEKEGTAPLQ